MNKFFYLLIFSLCTIVASAQEVEFTADRPGASTGPATVAHKVVQLEQGVQLDFAANLDLRNPAQVWAVSFGVAWQINNPSKQ